MKPTTCLHRPALAGIAALGLTTTVLLAPAAHASTELDPPEGSASTAVVADVEGAPGAAGEEIAEVPREETASGPAAGTGEEVAAEAGEQAPAGTIEDAAPDAGETTPAGIIEEAAPDAGEAAPADGETTPANGEATPTETEQDDLCVDGTAEDAQATETGTAGTDDAALNDATAEQGTTETAEQGTTEQGTAETAEQGTDDSAGVHDGAPSGEGTVADPSCAVTTPDQAGNGPGGQDGNETELPVGGVDAGKGEAVSQNMVLPLATAGAVAAAVGLGAYTLVRRRRSDA